MNSFNSYRTKEALKKHMKACEDKAYCYIEMPEKDTFIKYHSGFKSMRNPDVIYADIKSLLKTVDTCTNDPNKSSITRKNKHEMCGYSLIRQCSFDEKFFCQDLKRQAKSIVDYEKNEIIELTQEEQYKHDTRKYCFICKKPFFKDAKKIMLKQEIIVIILGNTEVLLIKYVILCITLQKKYLLYFIMVLVMITIS